MSVDAKPIPVIDLFAGPGGLGEGFSSSLDDGRRQFRSVLSIEKDASAHRTLQLRAFFRLFPSGQAPDEYYQLAQGRITLQELYAAYPGQAKQAAEEAWCVELGESAVTDVRQRIQQALGKSAPWVLLGGPPCQPFSMAGRSRRDTDKSASRETRHQLYVEYLQIIADFWPAVFVMENVRGLLTAKYEGVQMFDRIVEDLHDPAAAIERIPGRDRITNDKAYRYTLYPLTLPDHDQEVSVDHIHDYIVKSENHGIPQARHRLIVVGVRDDLASKPASLDFKMKVQAGDVLCGLPPLRSGLSKNDDCEEWRRTIQKAGSSSWLKELKKTDKKTGKQVERAIQDLVNPKAGRGNAYIRHKKTSIGYASEWYLDHRLSGVCNHESRGHMGSDLHRYLFAASFAKAHRRSPKLADFPAKLLPDHASIWQALGGNHFADRFRVQLANQPSTTVVSHIAKDGHYYIHYDPRQCRSLTVREAARLQTFPDNYLFMGTRTEQYTQVGNAVPPLLAKQIAGIVHDVLIGSGKL